MKSFRTSAAAQQQRNRALLGEARHLGANIASQVLPLHIDIAQSETLDEDVLDALGALQVDAARIAIRSLESLAQIKEGDHLGGGLELIPPLLLTLAVTDYDRIEYTIEHAHTSIGYYAALAALKFVDEQSVVEGFRRGLDIPGHVSWVPGGTQLNGGRLGVMIPVAVGQALGKRAVGPEGSWEVVHCGDAGWISGQALNGFNGAAVHRAPITFVMHRNGIQLSGSTQSIMDKDPRPIVEALGIQLIEIPTLHENAELYRAYRQAYSLAQAGRPSMIFPTGYRSTQTEKVDLRSFGERYGIAVEVEAFAAEHGVDMDGAIWIPGSLMSFRDVGPMIENLFLVNGLEGGHGHHDGHMQGRDAEPVLAHSMMQKTAAQQRALKALNQQPKRPVITRSRPEPGTTNLVLEAAALNQVSLPEPGASVSPRSGSEAGYAAVAQAFPDSVFVVGCDLDPSTKLGKARALLDSDHQFEMSIEEQAAALMANGLAMSSRKPQLNVVSTFAAFFEGIAREGFDMWRYQRNLNGINEGLNVTFHVSHVGSCTGRDHFSGWGLDWINIGLTYLPYLHRFYAPADARAAFLAVRDLAAHYGGHVIGIPRDNLPVLERQDGSGALWQAASPWEATTVYRSFPGARKAILALGAPAYLGAEAAAALATRGLAVDVYVVNGLPLPTDTIDALMNRYSEGIATIEDGFIGTPDTGVRGFAGLIAGVAGGQGVAVAHVGVGDPRTAPADGHLETWAHFGITTEALVAAVEAL